MAGPTQVNNEEHWSGKAVFILAAIGSAVGLGNLWRFPYVAGENGGGAFVLVYILCVAVIGLPVLVAELMIGRRGGGSAVSAVARLARNSGNSVAWAGLSWIGMIACFLILSFYSMIAGWVIFYLVEMVRDLFIGIDQQGLGAIFGGGFAGETEADINNKLRGLFQNPAMVMVYHAIFMGVTVFIVARGVKGGIESAVTILMPAFFIMLMVLVTFSLVQGEALMALDYLFKPNFEILGQRLTDGSVLTNALGQAFFSISLGSVMMLTYGIYMGKDQSIPSSARTVVIADTGVALIAGLAMFPIVFQFGMEPAAGPALIFNTLPLAFQQMPFGALFGIAFFLMATFAALTSSIALLEVSTAFADGDRDLSPAKKKSRRLWGAIIIGFACFLVGIAHIYSQVPAETPNFFNQWVPFDFGIFSGATIFGFADSLTANVMLPLGGFLTSLFAGWVVTSSAAREEIGFKSERMFKIWHVLVRYVCPIAVGAVMVYGLIPHTS